MSKIIKTLPQVFEQSPEELFWEEGFVQQVGSQKSGVKTWLKPFFGHEVTLVGVVKKPGKGTKAGQKTFIVASIDGEFGVAAGAHINISFEDVVDKAAWDAIEFGDKVVLTGVVKKYKSKKFKKTDFGLDQVDIQKVVSWKA